MLDKVRAWEVKKNSTTRFSSQDACRRKLAWQREEDSSFPAYHMEEDGRAGVGRKNSGLILDRHELFSL